MYQPALIEKKWQDFWVKNKTFKAEIDHQKKKLYILDMFPYPSGDGLHVGHVEGYTATDIFSRFKRMQGFNVLHTIGWDAFGLPAEQYAIRTGQHPAVTTQKNIANFRRQVQAMGFSYDWDREISTADPDFFRWTQWIFLQIYEQGLAYQDMAVVNWCPELRAVLANEEVKDGLSEIGGHPVIRMPLRQWILKITAYAERLLNDLSELEWPDSILEMQAHWIGKSWGGVLKFKVLPHQPAKAPNNAEPLFIETFTTRPDTLYGATFLALAPEHPYVEKIVSKEAAAGLKAYLEKISRVSERDRTNASKEKTGYFLGAYAEHPLTGKPLPIWVSEYILMGYGTGAIMAVPAHDQRDFDFATKYQLEIRRVVEPVATSPAASPLATQHQPEPGLPYAGEGVMVNSADLNGLFSKDAGLQILNQLEKKGLGKKAVQYKLRDWIFSRQRYWGEPIPMVLDDKNQAFPLAVSELPLLLPGIENYTPSDNGESPLAHAKDWLKVEKNGQVLRRETNTMPQWAGSCWYYLRFLSPTYKQAPFDTESEKYWMPVDLYVGGAEHAVLHLLYARFWHKVLYDLGLVHTQEPFKKLINQGMILGEDGVKMSKSRGNVISPDSIIEAYGADTLRVYEMFLGPLEKVKPWQSGAIDGVYRFLNRAWNWIFDAEGKLKSSLEKRPMEEQELKLIHPLIAKVTQDIEALRFNTAISALMIFLNEAQERTRFSQELAEQFVVLLCPFAPHFAEEAWQRLGHKESLAYHPWPKEDPKYLVKDSLVIPVQVNGKTRSRLSVRLPISQEALVALAEKDPATAKHLTGKPIQKVIYVPEKILNLIV